MPLLSLPEELLVLICTHSNSPTLKSLRLTCKILLAPSTKPLFRHVHVLPEEESAKIAQQIVASKTLNPLVASICFSTHEDTSVTAVDASGPDVSEEGDDHDVPAAWYAALRQCGRFSNLARAELKFHMVCSSGDDSFREEETTETRFFRVKVLRKFFAALNQKRHPASKVRALSIKNLQDLPEEELCTSDDFRAVMARLQTLELCIATECDYAAPEATLDIPEAHTFFGHDLRTYWLDPVAAHLTTLKLYTTEAMWGYFPKCDLRGLHFPKLKALHLGNMTFTHDWQLEWIVSHGKTLETLTLCDCPIVHAALLGSKMDGERYHTTKEEDYDSWPMWKYDTRWNQYFTAFQENLPKLKHFGLGYADWSHSGSAFENAEDIGVDFSIQGYIIFDQGTGPSPFIGPDENSNGQPAYQCCWEGEDGQGVGRLNYKEEDEKDNQALDRLLEAVRQRA